MLTFVAVAVAMAAVPTPNFPVSWSASEAQSIAIAQGTVDGPNGEICCAPTAPQCQAQTQSQSGTNYYDGKFNNTRFESPGQIVVTQWGQVNREMAVDPNMTCMSYCPVDGPFDPSPFWPTADQREKIKDLGKETVNGVETTHFQWVEHILGVIKIQETNMYVALPSAPGPATPVWEHDILEPFGQQAGIEDTHWTAFKPGQPDPSLFAVTGISKCQESPNCGQNDKKTRFSLEPAVDRQAREAKPSQAKPSQAKPADGSAGRLRCESPAGAASLTLDLNYLPGSTGWFKVTAASLMDNYNQGDLICIGGSLTNTGVSCVGFNNGGPEIFEATVGIGQYNAFVASYRFIKPDKPAQTPGPWPCTLSPQ